MGSAYRNLELPKDDPDFDRLRLWWEATRNRPSVAATLVCRERLVSSYSDYADNKGTSEYAKMIQASMGSGGADGGAAARGRAAQRARCTRSALLEALHPLVALGATRQSQVGQAATYRTHYYRTTKVVQL